MVLNSTIIFLLLANISAVFAFAPQFSADSGAAHDAMVLMRQTTTGVDSVSKSLISGVDSILLSVAQESETVTRQGLINWENPGEAAMGSITLAYIAFSVAAGIKYVVVDGYRPKL